MTSSSVIELSNKLLEYMERVEILFEETRENEETPNFFKEVKPFADEVDIFLQKWEKETIQWIEKDAPKYIHSNQIDSTVENIKHVSVQCFYPDTKEKKFKGMVQSIRYVLNDIVMKKQLSL